MLKLAARSFPSKLGHFASGAVATRSEHFFQPAQRLGQAPARRIAECCEFALQGLRMRRQRRALSIQPVALLSQRSHRRLEISYLPRLLEVVPLILSGPAVDGVAIEDLPQQRSRGRQPRLVHLLAAEHLIPEVEKKRAANTLPEQVCARGPQQVDRLRVMDRVADRHGLDEACQSMGLDQRADQLGAHFSPPGALSHRESAFVCLARDGMALGQAKHGSVDRSQFLIGAEDLALRYLSAEAHHVSIDPPAALLGQKFVTE